MSEEVGDAGYLVPFGDTLKIMSGIEHMMNNYESYKKLAMSKSQEVRSKYSWDAMLQQFEKLWK
jgi:glycosyltransferase involved in cell wall biosynthesis